MKGWSLVGAAVVAVVLGQLAGGYAYRTHEDLLWSRCLDNSAVPAAVWALAFVAPVLALAAFVPAGLLIRRQDAQGALAAATVVAVIAGLLSLLDVYTAVSMLTDGPGHGGDTCML